MTINIIIIILFSLLLLATPFIILVKNRIESQERIKKGKREDVKEEKDDKDDGKDKKEEPQKKSSSSSVLRSAINGLGKLVWLVVIILTFLFVVNIGYKTITTMLGTFYSSVTNTSETQEKVEWISEEDMVVGKVYEKRYKDTIEARILISADDWSDPITFLAAQEFIFNCDGCESGKRMEIMKNNRIITDGKTKWFTFDKNKPSSFKFKAIGSPTIVWVTYDEK